MNSPFARPPTIRSMRCPTPRARITLPACCSTPATSPTSRPPPQLPGRALAFVSGAGARRLPEALDPDTAGAAGLFGGGTLAGLRVRQVPAAGEAVEEIRIAPGLAVDRLGRLVEVPRAVCLRLERWFDGELAADGGDGLRLAALDDPARFASARLVADAPRCPRGR